ncbi:Sec8 exocyst complex component-specific domain-containing protein [Plectosphaerella cucumerina]|uniref:Exocyst complex component Sec8 n=1 Tax=Plectosphaerella cucumerina TaxID=40658 RepID=A0A8K0TI51_9PEZI|nr:Sec8 exocyst complex component-specific domain-containing protein [Plectosphaerella cucumerina]
MSNRYAGSYRNGNGYGNFGAPPPQQQQQQQYQQQQQQQPEDYDPYGDTYGGSSNRYAPQPAPRSRSRRPPSAGRNGPPPVQRERYPQQESNAERQITQVLEHIKDEWPSMCQTDCIPVQLALQLLDNSSVGRAHEYQKFRETHDYLQESLKGIVHEHHQGFNSSIGTFHKIQGSIQASQKRVRALKDSLASSKTSLCTTDGELKKLSATSQAYDELLTTLNEIDELRLVPDQLEARISGKRFLSAVDVLQSALRKLRKPELDDLGALSDLRSYLANQDTALMDILVEELHEHLYLKSPYCQERWQSLAKNQGATNDNYTDAAAIEPFHACLEVIDFEDGVAEDPSKNPEANTFTYIGLVVEALNKLGKLETAVDILKQRMPVELFTTVNETINEVDQRHPISLRGGSSNSEGLHIYGTRETQMRADVIYDLLWTLFGKFEAIAEGHRVFHESIKALIRREGAGNNTALLGSFKELWNLYQNEIRSLLHNYVTTDADIYQFSSSPKTGATKRDLGRENLFKFSEADPKSVDMVTEYEALDSIIRAAVPGLTETSRKGGADKKGANRATLDGSFARKSAAAAYEAKSAGAHKSLVEPSVFNMSLLLPPTLVFLQRLRSIVPPGSDLATSTLTSFLDNFLVNVFQPQLDETLAKLSDTIFGETDTFAEDQSWELVARKPIFKGTTAFFTVITAFCKMLTTIPPDQALSSLIITQMMRFYDRCFGWYKALVTKAQEQATDPQTLRRSATLALEPGEISNTIKALWAAAESGDDGPSKSEIDLLIAQTDEKSLQPGDIIQDKDTISSLCLLYTSMKWLCVKVMGLRHITQHDTDSGRPNLPRQAAKRWTLMNDPHKATSEDGPVYLPMTQETVQAFDGILSSYEELATTALLTLHLEVRCQIIYSIHTALSPGSSAPYILEQDVQQPDPQILSLNSDLINFDETITSHLRPRESGFIRAGLGRLIDTYLVGHAALVSPMNARGCGRMQLNILVLQQNLKNVEEGVDLRRAAEYFALFDRGPDGVVEKAKSDKEASDAEAAAGEPADEKAKAEVAENQRLRFTYDEFRILLELCYSEQVANPERGIAAAAKRQMNEKMLALSEYMWQT